jgi:uncharacterized protein YndB with AHSA1/START domain
MINNKTRISRDVPNKQLIVNRSFNAPLEQVWKAWTDSAILDQWWAPKPFQTITKHQDFREGGHWLYAMKGPDGVEHWCRENYVKIDDRQSIRSTDAFCDEEGNETNQLPSTVWVKSFSAHGQQTSVEIVCTYSSEEDMKTIVNMGFEEGFSMGMDNLDELLESQQKQVAAEI